MAQAPQLWYVTAGGREQGPFTPQQLRALVNQRKVGAATLVRRADMAQAVAAATVNGLLVPSPGPQQRSAAAAAPSPASPPAIDDDDDSSDQVEEADDSPQDQDADPRATVVQRLLSGGIDGVISIGLVVALFVMLGVATIAPVQRFDQQLLNQWTTELNELRDNQHAEHFRRILAIEAFPDLSTAQQFTDVDGQIEELTTALLTVAEVSPPEMVADEVIYAWRARRELTAGMTAVSPEQAAAARVAAISAEERTQVVDWQQYADFVAYVQRSEGAYRSTLRQIGQRFEQLQQKQQQQAETVGKQVALRLLLVLVIGVPLIFLWIPLCEWLLGASPGKLAVGQRVATLSGKPIGLFKALWRQVLRLIPFGFVTVFMAERQALHDSLSKTQVIAKDAVQLARVPADRSGGRRATRAAPTGRVRRRRR